MIDIPENEMPNTAQKWIALFAGILGSILGCFYYDTLTTIEFWVNPLWFLHIEDQLLFKLPGLLHALIALALIIPLYIRQIIAYRNLSIMSLLCLMVNIYLFSAWIQLATGFQGDFTNWVVNMSLLSAILLGWLGMKSIAGFSWIIVVAICSYNLINGSEMLSAWGVPFLILSIISIWFQTKMPLDAFFSSLKSEFSSVSQTNIAKSIKENIQVATSSAAEKMHSATLKHVANKKNIQESNQEY